MTSGALEASGSGTFFVGTADGRAFRYDTTSTQVGGSVKVQGEGHTNFVSSMMAGVGGQVYSAGFDDKLREVDPATGFTCVRFSFVVSHSCHSPVFSKIDPNRPATLSLGGQPKSLASTGDGTVFVVQAEKTGKTTVQAVRHNQTVYTLQPTYKAISVAASGNVVVVGGEVCLYHVMAHDMPRELTRRRTRYRMITRSTCTPGMDVHRRSSKRPRRSAWAREARSRRWRSRRMGGISLPAMCVRFPFLSLLPRPSFSRPFLFCLISLGLFGALMTRGISPSARSSSWTATPPRYVSRLLHSPSSHPPLLLHAETHRQMDAPHRSHHLSRLYPQPRLDTPRIDLA